MPNIKSQKDRVVQSKKEAAHNKAIKSNLKTVVKKADAAIDSNAENKDAAIKAAVSALDAAKNKGVIHKNIGRFNSGPCFCPSARPAAQTPGWR